MRLPSPAPASTRQRSAWPLLAICSGYFMVILDTTVVNVALPELSRSMHARTTDLQWVVDAYSLTFAALLLSGGMISDSRGAKRAFLSGIAIFCTCSLACAFAPDVSFLIAARAAQGVGAALSVPASLSLIQATFSERAARRRALGLWGGVAGIAGGGGPVVGGPLVSLLGWRSVFFINVPLGLAALALAGRVLISPPARPRRSGRPAADHTHTHCFDGCPDRVRERRLGLTDHPRRADGGGAGRDRVRAHGATSQLADAATFAVLVAGVHRRDRHRPLYQSGPLRRAVRAHAVPAAAARLLAAVGRRRAASADGNADDRLDALRPDRCAERAAPADARGTRNRGGGAVSAGSCRAPHGLPLAGGAVDARRLRHVDDDARGHDRGRGGRPGGAGRPGRRDDKCGQTDRRAARHRADGHPGLQPRTLQRRQPHGARGRGCCLPAGLVDRALYGAGSRARGLAHGAHHELDALEAESLVDPDRVVVRVGHDHEVVDRVLGHGIAGGRDHEPACDSSPPERLRGVDRLVARAPIGDDHAKRAHDGAAEQRHIPAPAPAPEDRSVLLLAPAQKRQVVFAIPELLIRVSHLDVHHGGPQRLITVRI